MKTMLAMLAVVLTATGVTACTNHEDDWKALRDQGVRQQQELAALESRLSEVMASVQQLQAKLATADTAPQKPETTIVNQAVTQCVKYVRSLETQKEKLSQVYASFDAYYNPGSGRVQNNNQFVDQAPVYAFNKCMASKGFPLT